MCAHTHSRRLLRVAACGLLAIAASGCFGYQARHVIQSDSSTQIWLSEKSQVRLRSAQSRVFEDTDKRQMLEAVVATLQDLGFQIEVLDETLGIVTAKKFLDAERPGTSGLA